MAVYGYCRVSTDRQANEGESLDVQRRQIEGYALMHGLTVDAFHVERGVSGSKPLTDRPEGRALMARLQPGDVVITPKLDRMFRSSLDALHILKLLRGERVSLHMIDLGGDVTTDGVSKLVFTILSAVAEAERDRIRERVQTTKMDQAQRGRFLGGVAPFGYAVGEDGDLVAVADQQAAIDTMRTMRAGGASFRTIASTMADQGFNVSHVTVKRLVTATA